MKEVASFQVSLFVQYSLFRFFKMDFFAPLFEFLKLEKDSHNATTTTTTTTTTAFKTSHSLTFGKSERGLVFEF